MICIASLDRAPNAARSVRVLLAAAVALGLAASATEAEAQRYGDRGVSRGDGGHRGHGGRGHRGLGVSGAAGAIIGVGAGLLVEHARVRAEERDEVDVIDDHDRPKRRPKVRREGPRETVGADIRSERRKRPEPKAKLVRTTPTGAPPRRSAERSPPGEPPRGLRPPAAPAAAGGAAVARAFVPDEVLCEVRAGTPEADIRALGRRQRLERLSAERFALTGSTIIRYRIRDRRAVTAAVGDLEREPIVASAQANNVYRLSRVAGALAETQYAAVKMRLPEAHASATGQGVAIAVIDSAVDPNHPALKGAVVESFDSVGGPFKPHSHGTAVASLAAGRGDLTSPAPAARIYAVRAFAPEQPRKAGAQGTTYHILRGLDWAASKGVKVVNMSFAGPRDAKVAEFIAAGAAKGAIHVAATGNEGPASPPLYPAADPNVIAVTATDAADRVLGVANRGAHLSVAAPGVDVLVATPGGGFGYLTGTSMAAAGVSGLVALLAEASPGVAAWQVRAALAGSARDLGAPGPDEEFGAGAADARAALDRLGTPVDERLAVAADADLRATPVSAGPADVAQRP